MKILAIIYFCILALMSLITFACYGWDKRQARNNNDRIPEANLHLMALIGGWPGALIGRKYFQHKTRKTWFTIKTWLIVAFHVGLIVFVSYQL